MVQTRQVETKGDACLRSCLVLFQRDEDDKGPQVTPPDTPPSTAKLYNNIPKDKRQH